MRIAIVLAVLLPAATWAEQPLVLVSDPWCPVACAASDPRPGYVVEIAKAVFEPAGYRIDYQIVPFARAEAMTNSGDAAGFIGVLKLPKRQHWAFPEQAQAQSRVCFYTRADSRWLYAGATLLTNQRVGTIRGYSYGTEIDGVLRHAKVDQVSGLDGFKRGLAKLQAKRIDAVVEYELVAQYQQFASNASLRNAGCSQMADQLYLAFSPARSDGPQLARILNEGVQRLKKTGELKKILQSYGINEP
jgi:polar amino acid transport system substrate-binding protein